jgi:hypothetical protein
MFKAAVEAIVTDPGTVYRLESTRFKLLEKPTWKSQKVLDERSKMANGHYDDQVRRMKGKVSSW